ncbi:MAG: 2-hydroxyacyl-CoA dehydratase [Candidatus Omnitrophica bacterium]|nr:2-hydroxyacyl-CoA dehydratase [Candidatus Omnitrophota bacterium]
MSQADPFHFYTRLHLRELTGLKAKNLTELAAHLETVPGSVVYHHTHHFLQQHQYLSPEPPNDFAYWVTEILQDKRLGERLASINTCDFKTIRELREKILSTIRGYLEKAKDLREAPEGEEFHLVKSISFVFPTPYSVSNLEEFAAVLKKITIHSIYFHMFEARIRLEKGTNDFSLWLEGLGEKELAQKIARLDPYTHTMEGLRTKVIQLVENRIRKAGRG